LGNSGIGNIGNGQNEADIVVVCVIELRGVKDQAPVAAAFAHKVHLIALNLSKAGCRRVKQCHDLRHIPLAPAESGQRAARDLPRVYLERPAERLASRNHGKTAVEK
jgi:hypothetical protein